MRAKLRFSLRTLLALTTITAAVLGAWQVSLGWGVFASVVSLALVVTWVIGPRRLARIEALCGPLVRPSDLEDDGTAR